MPYDNGVQCISCSAPSYWDSNKKACLQCDDGLVYNDATKVCQPCPLSAPIEWQGKCIACPNNTHYDQYTKVCYECGIGQIWNAQSNQCVTKVEQGANCSNGATWNVYTKSCECPSSAPFDNGHYCVSCNSPQFWNPRTKTCETCPDGYYYDANQIKCIQCAQDRPFEFNGVCYQCPAGSWYDSNMYMCVRCGQGSTYNPATNTCDMSETGPQCPEGLNYN